MQLLWIHLNSTVHPHHHIATSHGNPSVSVSPVCRTSHELDAQQMYSMCAGVYECDNFVVALKVLQKNYLCIRNI